MVKLLMEAIEKSVNLYQLAYYRGYVNASYNDGVLKKHDYKKLIHAIDVKLKALDDAYTYHEED